MFLKLEKAEEKYKSLNDQLLNIDISKDFSLQKSIMKELKHLEPIIEKFREYKKINKELEDCKEILSSSEQELKEMAELEIKDLNEKIEKTQEELKILLLPKDPNDDKNVIIEIRGGAGGDEAALFAANLFRMFTGFKGCLKPNRKGAFIPQLLQLRFCPKPKRSRLILILPTFRLILIGQAEPAANM